MNRHIERRTVIGFKLLLSSLLQTTAWHSAGVPWSWLSMLHTASYEPISRYWKDILPSTAKMFTFWWINESETRTYHCHPEPRTIKAFYLNIDLHVGIYWSKAQNYMNVIQIWIQMGQLDIFNSLLLLTYKYIAPVCIFWSPWRWHEIHFLSISHFHVLDKWPLHSSEHHTAASEATYGRLGAPAPSNMQQVFLRKWHQ